MNSSVVGQATEDREPFCLEGESLRAKILIGKEGWYINTEIILGQKYLSPPLITSLRQVISRELLLFDPHFAGDS